MSKNDKRSISRSNEPLTVEEAIRKSYDTVPQPKGEFKDLFRLMKEQKVEKRGEDVTRINKPSK